MADPMFTFDQAMTDLVFDYCRQRLALDPVPLDFGGIRESFDEVLRGLIRPDGNDPGRVLEIFSDHLADAVISCDSPRFLSFIPAAPTKASLLFDMVVSCSSLQATSWLEAAGAVAAENQALRFIADLAGFPAAAGGCFVSGGTQGNLSALLVARDVGQARRGQGLAARPMVAVSEEAHSSVVRALHVLGVEPLWVPTDDHRLTGVALRSALEGSGRRPDAVAVVATAGTTNAGLIDDLEGISEVAADQGLWLHVDAAYGGAALLAPEAQPLFRGIERADSVVVDPHKWLFAPFDCAGLVYRDPRLAKAVHTQDASYLDVIHPEGASARAPWNPSDYAIHLTRRARGLPLWFSLAVHGTDAYRRSVEAALDIAQRCAERVREADHLELVREPGLSVVLFRRPGWSRGDYESWSRRLLQDQVALVTPTTWEGEPVARLVFLHPNTTMEIVDEILDSMRGAPVGQEAPR